MDEIRNEFHNKGYVKIPRSIFHLTNQQIDILKLEFDNLFHGIYDTGIYPDEIHWRSGISKDNVTKEICNGWKSSTIIKNIVCNERKLGKIACTIMDWECSRIGQDDILDKPPNSTTCVGFHQDSTYISNNFIPLENNSITMWIALDNADFENGA